MSRLVQEGLIAQRLRSKFGVRDRIALEVGTELMPVAIMADLREPQDSELLAYRCSGAASQPATAAQLSTVMLWNPPGSGVILKPLAFIPCQDGAFLGNSWILDISLTQLVPTLGFGRRWNIRKQQSGALLNPIGEVRRGFTGLVSQALRGPFNVIGGGNEQPGIIPIEGFTLDESTGIVIQAVDVNTPVHVSFIWDELPKTAQAL